MKEAQESEVKVARRNGLTSRTGECPSGMRSRISSACTLSSSSSGALVLVILLVAGLALFSGAAHAGPAPNRLDYNGGPVLANPAIHNLYFDFDWDSNNPAAISRSSIDAATLSLANSDYFAKASQYGVGAASFSGSDGASFLCPPLIVAGVTDFFAIGAWMECMTQPGPDPIFRPVLTGIPAPNNDTVYAVYIPSNVQINDGIAKSCSDFGAYHFFGANLVWRFEFLFPVLKPQSFAYVVLPADCGGSALDGMTDMTSHELIEAATDPIILSGWIDNSKAIFTGDILKAGEASDICELGAGDVPTAPVRLANGLLVATYWSNADNACEPLRETQTIAFPAISSFSWSGGSVTLAATATSGLAVSYSVISGPCRASGSVLTAASAGTCVVAADQSGNDRFSAAPQVRATATVTKASQTLAFGPLANKLMTDNAFRVSALGGASGSPVIFSTSSTTCSVTGTTVTLASAGTCAIQADQAGDANYDAAAPVIQSFTISLAEQTITFPAIAGFSWSGGSATLAATASSRLAVSYSVQSGPCSVAGAMLTATAAGTCVVAADQAGDASYFAAQQATTTATVATADQTISFPALTSFSWSGGSATLAATASSGLAVSYSVTSGPCSVSGSTLTATTAGSCVVTAAQAGNGSYSAAPQVTESVTVAKADQTIVFPDVEEFAASGGSAELAATASSGLAVSYQVQSGPCIVTAGKLTATAPGICVVAANQAGDSSYKAAAEVTTSVRVADTDNGCGCHSTKHGAASSSLILIVAVLVRRRKRGSR